MAHRYDPLHIIKCGTLNESDTREQYMLKLHNWCAEATKHNMLMLEQWQHYCQQFQHSIPTPTRSTTPDESYTPASEPSTPNRRPTYYIYNIPPMWKRFAAEVIDFLILFLIKMFLTILLIENIETLDLESLSAFEEKLQNPVLAAKVTMEIFALETIHRIIVCFYEAYWIAFESATPGKRVMGLAVIHVVTIVQPTDDEDQVLAEPCTVLCFRDALVRAVLKNVFVGLLFPVCFVLLFFKYNRTGYDLLSNSLVVETDPF